MCTPPVSIPPGHHETLRVMPRARADGEERDEEGDEHDEGRARAGMEAVAERVDVDDLGGERAGHRTSPMGLIRKPVPGPCVNVPVAGSTRQGLGQPSARAAQEPRQVAARSARSSGGPPRRSVMR